MSRKNRVVSALSLLLFVAILSVVQVASASGVTVSPTFLKLSVSAQQESSSDIVSVKNNSERVLSYSASIVDVDTESGTLLPLNSTSELTTNVFKVNTPEFILQPEQTVNIKITAQNIEELSPGGHYAALHIQQLADSTESGSVPINQVIAVGLFLVKEDGAIRDLSFSIANQKRIWFTMPKSQKITVNNTGNVDLVPRGFVAVEKDEKIYQKVLFNETSQPVFPYQSKDYNLEFGKVNLVWPGRYREVVSLRYDGQAEQELTYHTVWYLPVWSLGLFCVLAAVIFVLLKRLKSIIRRIKLHKKPKTDNTKSEVSPKLITDVIPPKPTDTRAKSKR